MSHQSLPHGRTAKETLSAEEIARGRYSDRYFLRAAELVWEHMPNSSVKMQIFQKNHAVLGGMNEALGILRDQCRLRLAPEIWSLDEGAMIEPWETVMTIEGPYWSFAHLETPLLGVLARGTLLATNMHAVVQAANGKPVIYMGARHDHWCVQEADGYSAIQAGLSITTEAQGHYLGIQGEGTMPHSLIAAFGGDTVRAAIAFAERYQDKTDVVVLVDFENDCARTAVEVARALKEHGLPLWGVRLDTSEKLVDAGLLTTLGDVDPNYLRYHRGVSESLVRHVRETLNLAGFPSLNIVVSGGFSWNKIKAFELMEVPVDAYGVGSSLLRGSNDFTGDIVTVDGEPCAKVGRQENPNPRLKRQL